MDRLKNETANQHRQLEAQLDLFRPTFTKQDYAATLSSLYGFYKPWEEQAWPVLNQFVPSLGPERRKLSLLTEDLHFFGVIPETLSVAKNLPLLRTVPQVLGSCYVLEGATLGGQILSRHFARLLHLESGGLAYFRCYGERTGAMWNSFRQSLLNHVTSAEENAVIGSAVETFASLEVWLAKEA